MVHTDHITPGQEIEKKKKKKIRCSSADST